ncbi:LysM peptidoglycan-binding domain-containing protein [Macrococcus lamae]|uniref:LysM peptidoglycan-binding domain-containing protein n=1 Tax=Macrococcus lamae TaxID=198484 RepID=A0A4R6BV11_9STAP|nr:LysM peptidoglycan-binding domain-containing protein [Macrococcus lamae]TDM11939.1 LysM peptidoglycan-binding domain-containing protein [Macrococcus lamae]
MKKKVLIMATTATAAAAAYSHQADAASYTVKANDSLWAIANKYNTSVTELKRLNNLTSNLIFPNQSLVVSGTARPTAKKPVRQQMPSTTTTTTSPAGTHIVQSGESLSLIAMKYDTTYTKIMELNGLSSYLIFPGQKLKISGQVTSAPVKTPTTHTKTPATSTTTSGGAKYVVQPGDYLSKIAVQYSITVEQLKQWNGLTSNIIYPNQQLVVSSAVTTTEPVKTAPPAQKAPVQTTTSPVFNHPNWYDYGQCTWYVFNKRAAIGKGISTYWWNANNWAYGARKDGYTVNNLPEVGAIAQTSAGSLGHVAFVERVNADGTVLISETNYLTPAGVVGYRTLSHAQLTQYVFIH